MTSEGKDAHERLSNIPGLERGSEFLRRRTLDSERERVALKIRTEMPDQRADLLIVSHDKEFFLELPFLTAGTYREMPSWIPRYHPLTGAVFTTRWEEPLTAVGEKGKSLISPELFAVIRKPPYPKDLSLYSFPKSWNVARLIPQEVWGGIETALRQQDELLYDYTSVEHTQISDLLVALTNINETLKTERVTEQLLQEMSQEVQKILESHGILKPRDSVRRKLAEYTVRAVSRDRLGRINPGVGRILARVGFWKGVTREVEVRLVKQKVARVFSLLYMARGEERSLIENANDMVALLGGFGTYLGHPILTESYLRGDPTNIKDQDIHEIRAVIKGADELLSQVRVAPYLLPATIARALLRSNQFRNKKEKERMQAILGVGKAQGILSDPSFEDYLMRRDVAPAVARLGAAHSVSQSVLNDPDNSEITVFR